MFLMAQGADVHHNSHQDDDLSPGCFQAGLKQSGVIGELTFSCKCLRAAGMILIRNGFYRSRAEALM